MTQDKLLQIVGQALRFFLKSSVISKKMFFKKVSTFDEAAYLITKSTGFNGVVIRKELAKIIMQESKYDLVLKNKKSMFTDFKEGAYCFLKLQVKVIKKNLELLGEFIEKIINDFMGQPQLRLIEQTFHSFFTFISIKKVFMSMVVMSQISLMGSSPFKEEGDGNISYVNTRSIAIVANVCKSFDAVNIINSIREKIRVQNCSLHISRKAIKEQGQEGQYRFSIYLGEATSCSHPTGRCNSEIITFKTPTSCIDEDYKFTAGAFFYESSDTASLKKVLELSIDKANRMQSLVLQTYSDSTSDIDQVVNCRPAIFD
ncbi:MAG: hypothetical protein HOO06_11780 [Bdellovibrionaceae bacterium]|jgi:hypothetical protein|nr:hypothetical protein [Pseudobdellovibrionaceae bacterium]